MAMPSIMASSHVMGQYFCMSCATSSFCCGQSCICAFSSCRCASSTVASCILHIDVHTGRSTAVSIALMFMLRPLTSSTLFSLQLCHDSQSIMNSSGPGLYSIHTLYWYMCRIMCYSHCYNVERCQNKIRFTNQVRIVAAQV